jgi:hypothetical protein
LATGGRIGSAIAFGYPHTRLQEWRTKGDSHNKLQIIDSRVADQNRQPLVGNATTEPENNRRPTLKGNQ